MADAGLGGSDAGSSGGDGGVPACPAENDAASILERQMFDGQVSVKTPGVLAGGKCCYTVTRQEFVGC